ncbi:antirestriction protein, partial [Escherichia coli]|uniref:antirestriction protein n=1 Tax=Escherichia coli TaxID=562 RepID=UPI0020265428
FCGACGNNRTNRGGFQFAAARLPWFIAPDGYQLTLPNYFDEPVSAKEAGIIVALYAYSHFCCVAFERGWQRVNETMAERYHTLRDFTETLPPESQSRIFRAID